MDTGDTASTATDGDAGVTDTTELTDPTDTTIDATTDTTTDTTTGSDCDVVIDETVPAVGAVDAYYRTEVIVALSEADPGAVIRIDGVVGTSSLSADSEVITFTPDEFFVPSTTYTVTVEYCRGEADYEFTTSELGSSPITSPEDQAFSLDLAGGRWVEPAGVGDILSSYLEFDMLLGIAGVDGEQLDMRFTVADEAGEQDYCSASVELRDVDYSAAPYFLLGPADTTLALNGLELELQDFELSGAFAPDYSYIGGVSFSGVIDTRPLIPLLDDDPEALDDTVCELMAGFGVDCVPCPDEELLCLRLSIVDIDAEQIDGPLEYIAQNDCHEDCSESLYNDECF